MKTTTPKGFTSLVVSYHSLSDWLILAFLGGVLLLLLFSVLLFWFEFKDPKTKISIFKGRILALFISLGFSLLFSLFLAIANSSLLPFILVPVVLGMGLLLRTLYVFKYIKTYTLIHRLTPPLVSMVIKFTTGFYSPSLDTTEVPAVLSVLSVADFSRDIPLPDIVLIDEAYGDKIRALHESMFPRFTLEEEQALIHKAMDEDSPDFHILCLDIEHRFKMLIDNYFLHGEYKGCGVTNLDVHSLAVRKQIIAHIKELVSEYKEYLLSLDLGQDYIEDAASVVYIPSENFDEFWNKIHLDSLQRNVAPRLDNGSSSNALVVTASDSSSSNVPYQAVLTPHPDDGSFSSSLDITLRDSTSGGSANEESFSSNNTGLNDSFTDMQVVLREPKNK